MHVYIYMYINMYINEYVYRCILCFLFHTESRSKVIFYIYIHTYKYIQYIIYHTYKYIIYYIYNDKGRES